MQTKSVTWFDKDKMREMFGIKVHHPVHRWINAGNSDGLYMFDTKEQCDEKRAELRSLPLPVHT